MKKVAILLLVLFAFDILADGVDLDCMESATDAGCHSCLCQNHGTGLTSAPLVQNSLTVSSFISNHESIQPDLLSIKGVFRPPKFPA
ncbi:MAG: hypothetical protein A3G34_16140 [Candidatus Lindowbacteria bacterium RIFCSPLOWO2_12_FULL_62_27]|nr:MAG: hypothetical protein A3I06_12315 [Candidatus Lindowbacteria bacterium RIFCSPLOWO2_02_FULL_62_12]OGH61154.1 MAG: hypothetical protein A3G34_16140 [Candidatus Lindowbacteria bacterium RIFCSPLOWO2_12_FULL_62_27]